MTIKDLINKDRYKYFGKYKFDRFIFQFVMYGIFLTLFLFGYSHNWQLDYYSCGEDNCKNPFYEPVTWKNAEYLPFGEYGLKPTWYLQNAHFLAFGLIFLAVVVNHLIHNRSYNLSQHLDKIETGEK